jgi:hypothetical protein
MKIIAGVLGVVIALSSGHGERGERATWRQNRGGALWMLDTVVTETAGPHGWACELVRFTVRRDGKFVHSSSLDGGRLAGMKLSFGNRSEVVVEDLLPEAGAGWIISVAESTGNACSRRACIITPGVYDTYEAVVISTKSCLTQRVVEEGVELGGVYQEWGGGGTSTSVYVPFRLLVCSGGPVTRRPLSSDQADCADPEVWFAGIFIAGMRERNPDLMQSALDRLFVEQEPDPDPLMRDAGLGLPYRRADLQRMIEDVRAIAEGRQRLRKAVRSIEIDDPLGSTPPR